MKGKIEIKSKGERNVAIVIIAIMILSVLLPYVGFIIGFAIRCFRWGAGGY